MTYASQQPEPQPLYSLPGDAEPERGAGNSQETVDPKQLTDGFEQLQEELYSFVQTLQQQLQQRSSARSSGRAPVEASSQRTAPSPASPSVESSLDRLQEIKRALATRLQRGAHS